MKHLEVSWLAACMGGEERGLVGGYLHQRQGRGACFLRIKCGPQGKEPPLNHLKRTSPKRLSGRVQVDLGRKWL